MDYSEGPEYSASELRRYQAVRWNEPDGKPSILSEGGPRPQELGGYKAVRHNEPDGKPSNSTATDGPEGTSELSGYKAVRYNEPDGRSPEEERDLAATPSDVEHYAAVRHNEPDGKPNLHEDPVAESLKDFEGLARDNNLNIAKKYSKDGSASSKLTGNYTRDFPEEFEQKWTGPYTASGPRQDKKAAGGTRVQPSLDRQKAKLARHRGESKEKANAPASSRGRRR